MALKEDRIARKRVNARIERGQYRQRAENEMAIMYHAVWVARRGTIKRRIGLLLKTGANGIAVIAATDRRQRSQNRQRNQHQKPKHSDAIASQQPPFIARYQPYRVHAATASP